MVSGNRVLGFAGANTIPEMVVHMFILVFLASKVAVAFCHLILHYIRPGRLLAL